LNKRVDVVLLTKNSLDHLTKHIDSVIENVPVNRLIVVDGGSTDGTVEFLEKKMPGEVKVIEDRGNRATGRQSGIDEVKTEWHLHVDSDVGLSQDWFARMQRYVEPDVGAMWGVTIPIEIHTWNRVWALSKMYRTNPLDLQINQQRYYTHDTLIRTEAVRGIHIPSDLHVFEDQFIGSYIVKKGYRFLKVKEPCCYHDLHDPGKRLDEYVLGGYFKRKYHYATFAQVARLGPEAIPKFLWVLAWTRDFQAARSQLMSQTMQLKGWLLAG
jgi:glycosyltransferase involved in cell wall biosynthesis